MFNSRKVFYVSLQDRLLCYEKNISGNRPNITEDQFGQSPERFIFSKSRKIEGNHEGEFDRIDMTNEFKYPIKRIETCGCMIIVEDSNNVHYFKGLFGDEYRKEEKRFASSREFDHLISLYVKDKDVIDFSLDHNTFYFLYSDGNIKSVCLNFDYNDKPVFRSSLKGKNVVKLFGSNVTCGEGIFFTTSKMRLYYWSHKNRQKTLIRIKKSDKRRVESDEKEIKSGKTEIKSVVYTIGNIHYMLSEKGEIMLCYVENDKFDKDFLDKGVLKTVYKHTEPIEFMKVCYVNRRGYKRIICKDVYGNAFSLLIFITRNSISVSGIEYIDFLNDFIELACHEDEILYIKDDYIYRIDIDPSSTDEKEISTKTPEKIYFLGKDLYPISNRFDVKKFYKSPLI